MKRLVFVFAALFACAAFAKAQEADSTAESGRDRLEKLEQLANQAKEAKAKKAEKLVNFEMVGHFGFGSHLVDNDGFNQDFLKCREIWFNAFELTFNPAYWFSASLGLNLKWDKFLAANDAYIYADAADGNMAKFAPIATQQALYPGAGGDFKKLSSRINLFSLEAPLLLGLHIGDFGVKLGAQAVVPLTARQNELAEFGSTRVKTRVKDVAKIPFYYGFYGELNYDDLGVYAKFCPAEVLPGTVQDLMTIGLVLNF